MSKKLVSPRKLIGGKTGKRYKPTPIRVPSPATKLNSKAGAADFESMLPNGWSAEYRGQSKGMFPSPRDKFHGILVRTKNHGRVGLELIEHSDFIEVEVVWADKKGRGHGTNTMLSLKKYADAKNKGIMVRNVSNLKFFDKFDWLTRAPDPLADYGANPIYVYNVSWRKAEPLAEMTEGGL